MKNKEIPNKQEITINEKSHKKQRTPQVKTEKQTSDKKKIKN